MLRISTIVNGGFHRVLTQTRLIILLEVTLVVLLAAALARLAADLVGGVPEPPAGVEDRAAPMTGALPHPSRQAVSASIELKNLFGIPQQATPGSSPADENLQETRLDLTLKGIIADTGDGVSLALIATPGDAEEIYRVGDTVEGAEIVRIEPRRVVIRYNGNTEALNLEIPKVSSAQVNRSVSRFAGNGIRRVNETDRVVTRQALTRHLDNLPRLLQQARAIPYTENGENTGFRIVALQAGSVFEELGLERNDVIRSVNGTPLKTPEDALDAYRNLRTTSSFQLEITRRGRPVTLNLNVQ